MNKVAKQQCRKELCLIKHLFSAETAVFQPNRRLIFIKYNLGIERNHLFTLINDSANS